MNKVANNEELPTIVGTNKLQEARQVYFPDRLNIKRKRSIRQINTTEKNIQRGVLTPIGDKGFDA